MFGGWPCCFILSILLFNFIELMSVIKRWSLIYRITCRNHLVALVGYPYVNADLVFNDGTKYCGSHTFPYRFVYASTGSNYGQVFGNRKILLTPVLYGRTKTRAEEIFLERDDTVSLRFATAFGIAPRLRLDLMINDFAHQAIHQKYLVVYEKHFRRTFIHVRDIARAIVHVSNRDVCNGHKVFNVGDESLNYTKEEIVNLLRQKIEFLVHFAEIGSDADKRDYEVDYSRIRQTGFRLEEIPTWELGIGDLCHFAINPYSNV